MASISGEAAAASVALMMMDTSEPEFHGWAQQGCSKALADVDVAREVNVNTLTYYLNLQYARRHGYDLLMYRLQGHGCKSYVCGHGCNHERYGPRHASYCKVAGLGAALSTSHDWIVFLDSDAFMANVTLSLPALIRSFGGVLDPSPPRPGSPPPVPAEAFFGWDWPYTLGPNMGFIAMRNTPSMRDLVRDWWNLDPLGFSNEHPFEQRTLQWGIMHMTRFQQKLQTLNLVTMDPEAGANAVAHMDHNLGTRNRQWTMSLAIAEHLCSPRADGAAPRHCGTEMRRALSTLRNRPSTWKGWTMTRRSTLLRTVLEAACDEFEATGPHAPILSFDATASAQRTLRQPSDATAEALDGIPLVLLNCTTEAPMAEWQTWLASRRCRGGGTACPSPHDVLSLRGPPDTSGGPRLCLSMGGTRSARQPYAVLAALAPCEGSEEGGAEATPPRLRSELLFSSASRLSRRKRASRPVAPSGGEMLATVADVGEIRKGLPEHRTNCGFWSDCTGMRVILPKPCWSQLGNDTRACGDSEPMIEAVMARMQDFLKAGMQSVKKDLRDGFVLGPAGPVRRRALGPASDSDRLCMSTWRAAFTEGTPVTFGRCPRLRKNKKWASAGNFEWMRVPAGDTAEGEARSNQPGPPAVALRLSPTQAPHLCVAAPALLPSGNR